MTASVVFADTAQALAAAHGVDVDVVTDRRPGVGAHATVRRRRSTITVAPDTACQPGPVQAFMAAHEVAHVVLGHRYWYRAWPGAVWALAVSLAQVTAMVLLLAQPRGMAVGVVSVAVGLGGPLIAGLGAQALLAGRTRRCETAADRLALAWGYRLDGSGPSLASGETRLTTSWWYRPFRMHPLPDVRLDAGRTHQGEP